MVQAARETTERSRPAASSAPMPAIRLACELVRNGRIGRVHSVDDPDRRQPVGGPFPVEAGAGRAQLGLLAGADAARRLRQETLPL